MNQRATVEGVIRSEVDRIEFKRMAVQRRDWNIKSDLGWLGAVRGREAEKGKRQDVYSCLAPRGADSRLSTMLCNPGGTLGLFDSRGGAGQSMQPVIERGSEAGLNPCLPGVALPSSDSS